MSWTTIIPNCIDEDAARELCGDEAVDDCLALHCDFAGTEIPEEFGVTEMTSTIAVKINRAEAQLTVHYLVDSDSISDADGELGNLDYTDYVFTVD